MLWLWAVPAPVHAQESVELKVKPLLCILDNRNDSCDINFDVRWQSSSEGSYCLNDEINAKALACWIEESQGQHQEKRAVKKPIEFVLTDIDENTPRAKVQVDVMSTKTTDRRRKRSRRHVWSVL